MVKCCLILNVVRSRQENDFYFVCEEGKSLVRPGWLYDLSGMRENRLNFSAECNDQIIGFSDSVDIHTDVDKETAISIVAENSENLGCIYFRIGDFIKEVVCGNYLSNNNLIRTQVDKIREIAVKREAIDLSNNIILQTLQNRLKSEKIENDRITKNNQVLSSSLEEITNQGKEEKLQKELLISENLKFQNEIFELHEKLWENERKAKDTIIAKEKEILLLKERMYLLEKNVREQKDLVDQFRLDQFLLRNQLSNQNKISPIDPINSEVCLEDNDKEIFTLMSRIEELLTRQCLTLINQESVPDIKITPAKLKVDKNRQLNIY